MHSVIDQLIAKVGDVLLGKEHQVRLSVSCLLAGGHLLIEDLPGMGKTTLAHGLAKAFGLKYERVQFTSDLMPSDILGVSVFDRERAVFNFHQGPVFTQVLLADEINRSTPKTQSALLEAMEEGQVSIEGLTRTLPEPFFVIATQNPSSQQGTFELPESQLDRFLMRISLGYPSWESERQLFKGADPRKRIKAMDALVTIEEINQLKEQVDNIMTSEALLDYLQRLVEFTRSDQRFITGISPRGALSWLRAAKSWALIHHRDFVLPDDLQIVMPAVVGHRVKGTDSMADDDSDLLNHLINSIDVLA